MLKVNQHFKSMNPTQVCNPSCQGEWTPDRNRDAIADAMAILVVVIAAIVYVAGPALLLVMPSLLLL